MTTTAPTAAQIGAFRDYIQEMERAGYEHRYPEHWNTIHARAWVTRAKVRRKYVAIDVDTSGRYLVDRTTGEIWGIKAYGKKHDGYFYGHVQDVNDPRWPGAGTLVTGAPAKRGAAAPAPTAPTTPNVCHGTSGGDPHEPITYETWDCPLCPLLGRVEEAEEESASALEQYGTANWTAEMLTVVCRDALNDHEAWDDTDEPAEALASASVLITQTITTLTNALARAEG